MNNKKGVSLVELIAVIVVMGVIAGIAVPTTIGVIKRTKLTACTRSVESVMASCSYVMNFETHSYIGCEEDIEEVFRHMGLKPTDKERQFSGLCLIGGNYYYEITEDGGLTIGCTHSEHATVLKITSSDDAFDLVLKAVNNSNELKKLLDNKNALIDSNSINGTKTGLCLDYIKNELGVNLDDPDYTFRFHHYSDNSFSFFYTDINDLSYANQEVPVVKMVKNEDGTVTKIEGTAKLTVSDYTNPKTGERAQYLVIDDGKFKASKK